MLVAVSLAIGLVGAAAHPHLFFEAADVAHLRTQATTTHKAIADNIIARLNAHVNDPAPTPSDYDDPRFFGNEVAAWAFAFQITGDTRYAARARLELVTYLTWSDWGFGEGDPDLMTGHMLLGVAAAYDWLAGTYLTSTDAANIRARLGTEAQRMFAAAPTVWWTDEYIQNHHWINNAGLGLAALALAGEDARSPAWLAYATTQSQNIARALGPITDGSWHEGIPYQGYGLSMALPFWAALARAGSDFTDLGILRSFGRYRLSSMIPEDPRRTFLPFGDFTGNTPEQTTEVLRYTASRFRDGFAEAAAQKWLAAGPRTNNLGELWYEVFEFLWYDPTVAPIDPSTQPLDIQFSDIQAAVLRSQWAPGGLTVSFKAAPYGGRFNWDRVRTGGAPGGHLEWGHDHNDDMSFWLHGAGTWLAPESMGYLAGRNGGCTNCANSSVFHNGIMVDGQGQLGDSRLSDSEWNNPWFWNRDATTLLPATGTKTYAITGGRGAKLFDPALGLTRWDRLVVLSRNRYAIVHDDLQATVAHTWDWLCHFPDGASPDGTGWVKGTSKNGQGLGVRIVSPASWTATTGAQTADQMYKFDPDASTSYVMVRPSAAAASQQFLAALVPVPTASWASKPAVTALDSADPGAGLVVAQSSAGPEERWIFARAGSDGKAAGDLALTQGLVAVSARQDGVPVRAFLIGPGKFSDQGGARELLSSHSATVIEAEVRGATLAVSGENIADFHAYAPGATQATLNGAPVAVDFVAGAAAFPSVNTGGSDGGVDGGASDGGRSDAGVDAGPADAGTIADAGVDAGPADAGTIADAGVDAGPADAGPIADAGVDAGPADAGTIADAGVDAGPADTGTIADAGVDAGPAHDGGPVDGGFDAGSSDAGTADAGVDGGHSEPGNPDAGSADAGSADAGSAADAGTVAGAGNAADAGSAGGDAGLSADAGSTSGTAAVPVTTGGCGGCGGGSDAKGAGLLLILGLLATRRRKR